MLELTYSEQSSRIDMRLEARLIPVVTPKYSVPANRDSGNAVVNKP
jgi:hypothetical protein